MDCGQILIDDAHEQLHVIAGMKQELGKWLGRYPLRCGPDPFLAVS